MSVYRRKLIAGFAVGTQWIALLLAVLLVAAFGSFFGAGSIASKVAPEPHPERAVVFLSLVVIVMGAYILAPDCWITFCKKCGQRVRQKALD